MKGRGPTIALTFVVAAVAVGVLAGVLGLMVLATGFPGS